MRQLSRGLDMQNIEKRLGFGMGNAYLADSRTKSKAFLTLIDYNAADSRFREDWGVSCLALDPAKSAAFCLSKPERCIMSAKQRKGQGVELRFDSEGGEGTARATLGLSFEHPEMAEVAVMAWEQLFHSDARFVLLEKCFNRKKDRAFYRLYNDKRGVRYGE